MHVINIPSDLLFQALSDQTRIRIMRLFVSFREESCLCEIVDGLNEPQYNLSRHLKALRQAGLLSSQKEGRWVYHKLVEGVPYLKRLYALIGELPDVDDVFKQDAKRFEKSLQCRSGGRCKRQPVIAKRVAATAKKRV